MPFGFLSQPRERAGARLWTVLAASALLSFGCELSQLFSHSRIPSSADIVCDVIGAAIGVAASTALKN
jgi:VanZ family protein